MEGVNFYSNIDPFSLMAIMVAFSLAPFVIIMLTSFMKIVVVMSLIRNALGVQQIPPNVVVNGLAIMLSIYIMVPVINETYSIVRQQTYEKQPVGAVIDNIKQAKDPIHRFLARHSSDREKMFFVKTARLMWPQELAQGVTKDDFLVLIPAFTVSELTTAFQIGFLIYLPFIAIDLVVSNILLALGMMMVSPMTISLPFKLLLFVLIEGWSRLIQGLVLSYK